jgi:hypothetical protein
MRKTENEVLCDAAGRVVGRSTARRILTARERQWATTFVEKVSHQKGEAVMSKTQTKKPDTNEKTNMVFLAGLVQTANIEEERAFFALDVGMKQWVPCSAYKNEEIIRKLRGLYKGDFIQLKALVKPWSKKNDKGEWDRGMSIEVTEVKNIVKGNSNGAASDDDLPF